MKKIEYTSLELLTAGENIAISINGKIISVWIVPYDGPQYTAMIEELKGFVDTHPSVDFYVVDLKETNKPKFFTNWYCIKENERKVTFKAMSRKDYIALKKSLKNAIVYMIS